jgi:hypothetical protein
MARRPFSLYCARPFERTVRAALPSLAIAATALGVWPAGTALASPTCTILYSVDARFEITDTALGRGDIFLPVEGSLVIEYAADRNGDVIDGKVKVLHYAMYEEFTINSVVTVKTYLHHFAPTCNGASSPSWRRPSDEGFPKSCAYDGNRRAVAVGELERAQGRIQWAKCNAAPTYWSRDRNAYKPSDKSRGRGCLNEMHAVGNVHCSGRVACKLGGLNAGDNPQSIEWNQPLVHGPPDSQDGVSVSDDLRTITTPVNRLVGPQSYNIPNDAPSRTWFSFVATRNDRSPYTTCSAP